MHVVLKVLSCEASLEASIEIGTIGSQNIPAVLMRMQRIHSRRGDSETSFNQRQMMHAVAEH